MCYATTLLAFFTPVIRSLLAFNTKNTPTKTKKVNNNGTKRTREVLVVNLYLVTHPFNSKLPFGSPPITLSPQKLLDYLHKFELGRSVDDRWSHRDCIFQIESIWSQMTDEKR